MKYFIFLGVLLQVTVSTAQLPTSFPNTPLALDVANKQIAKYFSPTIRHMVENVPDNGLNGRADLITSVFFDGNFNTGDNWDNLANYSNGPVQELDPLDPYVYYSVVWLEDHWVITYAFYHPRDYADNCCWENHENDLEGAIFVVNRNTQEVTNGATIWHEELFEFDGNGEIPQIFIDNANHAVEANIGIDGIAATGPDGINYPCDNFMPFSLPHVVYSYAEYTDPFVQMTNVIATIDEGPQINVQVSVFEGEGIYVLEDIFGSHEHSLINERFNSKVFIGADQDKFYREAPENDEECQEASGYASAPWGWGQFDYTDETILNLINEEDDIIYNPYFPDPLALCQNGITVEITEDEVKTTPFPFTVDRLVVKTGVTFELKDVFLELSNNGSIFLETGSKLIINNTHITACDEQWDRLYMDGGDQATNPFGDLAENDAPVVIIKNQSIIEKSSHGITNQTDAFNDWSCQTQPCTWARGIIIALNSTFRNNYKAIGIMGAHANKSRIKWCNFNDNYQGIRVYNIQNVKVENCVFSNHEHSGILAVDAFVNIKGGNNFFRNNIGINIKGTYPGAAGVNIGDPEGNSNAIYENNWGIVLNGATHPAAATIVNNSIYRHFGELNNGQLHLGYNIGAGGDVLYEISNNFFDRSHISLLSVSAGSEVSLARCNEFNDQYDGYGIYYYGTNSQSQFLQNDFLGAPPIPKIHVVLQDGTLANQGEISSSANCFGGESSIFSDFEIDNSASFAYHHYTPPCEIPDDPDGFSLTASDLEGDHCDRGIGIFGIISDDDPNILTMDNFDVENPNQVNYNNICKSCIEGNINNYTSLLGTGSGAQNAEYQQYFESWLLYGLFIAQMTYDYDFGLTLLEGFSEWKYLKRKYGLYILKREYSNAINLLNSISPVNEDESTFIEIQQINLDRLTNTNQEYVLSQNDYDRLMEISQLNLTSSGYARSLLALLTDVEQPLVIPALGNSDPRSIETLTDTNIEFYPNPVAETITIKDFSPNEHASVVIRDVQGNAVLNQKMIINPSTDIDVSSLQNGFYFIEIRINKEVILTNKFIKI